MPSIEILDEDIDSGIDFKEPEPGESGFHSIAISPPQQSSARASLLTFGVKLAEPVEPAPEDFKTPPARRSTLRRPSLTSMASQAVGINS